MFSSYPDHSDVKRYALSAALVVAAAATQVIVNPIFGGASALASFTIAVSLAGLYGGVGPGLLATALSIGTLQVLSAKSLISVPPGEPNILFFGALGIGISVVIENFRSRNRDVAVSQKLLEAANKDLAQRTTELTQINVELKRFAYALSHDLKNPLRTVYIFSERLERRLAGTLDDESVVSLGFIRDGARQAQEMIHRLLEYSIAAQLDKENVATDLNAVLADAYADVRLVAQESGTHLSSDTLPVVQGDGQRLRLVFMNLLTNAIKYRGPNPPEIHVSARYAEDEWTICVRDNGLGINPRYADKIFELFERLHNSKQYEGSGVGLALCRVIVQRHGGRIWVESELGKGSTFCFTLPVNSDVAPVISSARTVGIPLDISSPATVGL